jgi:hypothetical protein
MSSLVSRFALGLSLLIVSAASVGRTVEVQQPWSQAEVVALTEQLSAALDELLADPGLRAKQTTAYQQRKHEAAIVTVKKLRPRAADLRKRVASGYDRDATQPYFEQVAELREEIAAYAAESWLPDSARAKVVHVRAVFDRLARYYP